MSRVYSTTLVVVRINLAQDLVHLIDKQASDTGRTRDEEVRHLILRGLVKDACEIEEEKPCPEAATLIE